MSYPIYKSTLYLSGVSELPVSFETANKILQKELMKPEFQPPIPHRSIWEVIWSRIVSFFHLDAIHIHHTPITLFIWMGALLLCGMVVFIMVAWLRRPKRGREIVYVIRGNRQGVVPALDGARLALSSGRLSDFLQFLVQACVEYALKRHFVRDANPGKTVRVLEREIARNADTSFYTLFHDIRVAAESVHFAHRQLSSSTCMTLLERMEAVYKEVVT